MHLFRHLKTFPLAYHVHFRKTLRCNLFNLEICVVLLSLISQRNFFPLYSIISFSSYRDPNHPSVPYHYYEPFGPDECTMYLSHERGRKGSHHRFITEKRVFKNWARTFNIHFFQPDWKPESLALKPPENKPVFWAMRVPDQNPRYLPY